MWITLPLPPTTQAAVRLENYQQTCQNMTRVPCTLTPLIVVTYLKGRAIPSRLQSLEGTNGCEYVLMRGLSV